MDTSTLLKASKPFSVMTLLPFWSCFETKPFALRVLKWYLMVLSLMKTPLFSSSRLMSAGDNGFREARGLE